MDRNLAIKKKAQQLIQRGQIDAALVEFDKLFDGGDKDPYDFILVADLLAKRGSMQEAVRRYRQAVEEYGKAELFKNAIAVCKKILRISKEDLEIHRTLGDLYAKEGLYGDAQLHYLEFAEGSIRRQEHEAALDVLDLVLALSPDNDDISEKYVEIATRADLPERGGRELLRRSERADQAGRAGTAAELRDRASTLSPSLTPDAEPGDPSARTARAKPAKEERTPIEHGSRHPSGAATEFPAGSEVRALESPPESGGSDDSGFIEPGVISLDRSSPAEIESSAVAEVEAPDLAEPAVEPVMEEAAPETPEPVAAPPAPESVAAPPAPEPVAAPPAPEPVAAPPAPEPLAAAPSPKPEPPPKPVEPRTVPAPAVPAMAAEAAPPSHEELGAAHLSAGNKELATEEFWKAAELSFFRGDLSRARTLLASLLKIAPQHEAALRRMVDVTAQTEDKPEEARARFDLAELYLSREEWALARAEYTRVLELDHSNERARIRVQRLDAMMNGPSTHAPSVDFDSIEVPKPVATVRVRDDSPVNVDGLVDLEEIIDEFKQGVQNSISGEDHESHYDLGMAYMEMGLYDEAIAEFRIAQKGAPMELKCLEMIALCFLEKNEAGEAVRELTRALEVPGHGPDETISIRYNLGMANERLGNLDRALQHFEEVHLLNVDFLKVATKIRELKQKLSGSRDRA